MSRPEIINILKFCLLGRVLVNLIFAGVWRQGVRHQWFGKTSR